MIYIWLCPVITGTEKEKMRATHTLLFPLVFLTCVFPLLYSLFLLINLLLFFVSRLSIPNMEDLKRRILKIVSNCNKPKVKNIQRTDISVVLQLGTICQYFHRQWFQIFFCVCSSTASCCRDVGTRSLEETQMTSLLRWTTGGRRSLASRCWGRSHWWFATHHPIRAWRQMTRLPTPLHTYLSSCLDAFCISQKMGRHGGLSAVRSFLNT